MWGHPISWRRNPGRDSGCEPVAPDFLEMVQSNSNSNCTGSRHSADAAGTGLHVPFPLFATPPADQLTWVDSGPSRRRARTARSSRLLSFSTLKRDRGQRPPTEHLYPSGVPSQSPTLYLRTSSRARPDARPRPRFGPVLFRPSPRQTSLEPRRCEVEECVKLSRQEPAGRINEADR
jgi:hypothetical protein